MERSATGQPRDAAAYGENRQMVAGCTGGVLLEHGQRGLTLLRGAGPRQPSLPGDRTGEAGEAGILASSPGGMAYLTFRLRV